MQKASGIGTDRGQEVFVSELISDRKIIAKVGTSSMSDVLQDGSEVLNLAKIEAISNQVNALLDAGNNVGIVTSGAVAAGIEQTGGKFRPQEMPEIQRLAGIGMPIVVGVWAKFLDRICVQMLVEKKDFDPKAIRDNDILSTTFTAWSHGDVIIANENDVTAHAELEEDRLGQNDAVGAYWASGIASDPMFLQEVDLVFLTDVDGFYKNYGKPNRRLKRKVSLAEIDSLASEAVDSGKQNGRGDAYSKLLWGKYAIERGVSRVCIVNSSEPDAIRRGLIGEIGTMVVK